MPGHRKKILVLSPIFPYPLRSGGQVRIFNLIKHLSDIFDISLLSLIGRHEENYVSNVAPFCRAIETVSVIAYQKHFDKMISFLRPSQLPRTVRRCIMWTAGMPFHVCRFYHPEMVGKLERLIVQEKYDIVYAVYSQMAPYLTMVRAMDRKAKTVLEDNELSFVAKRREYAHKKGLPRLLASLECRRTKEFVIKTWPSYDKVIVMSDLDKEKLLALNDSMNISVVPNGVDLEHFHSVRSPKSNQNRLVFLGGSRHYPNLDALRYFCSEILPLVREDIEDVSLTVVGEFTDQSLGQSNDSVRYTGYVDDLRPYLTESRLLVAPIRIGGGTRLKILEAMSLGLPVVSTSIGCEGIDAEKDKDILIADDAHNFALGIKALLRDESLRDSLSRNGQRLVQQKYGWKKIFEGLAGIFQYEMLTQI